MCVHLAYAHHYQRWSTTDDAERILSTTGVDQSRRTSCALGVRRRVIGQSFPLLLCLLFTPNSITLSACSVHQQRMLSLFMIAGLGLAEN